MNSRFGILPVQPFSDIPHLHTSFQRMDKPLVKMAMVFTILMWVFPAKGCFILFLSDGQRVLVGNHEDWFAGDAAVVINPRSANRYGSVTFTFLSEGWAQGGMNEKGLFFDGAATPFQDVVFDPAARAFAGHIWQSVLDKCATVSEALALLQQYRLPDLSESHIMLADATGHAAVVGVENGRVVVKESRGPFLMQTNFNPWQPELSDEPECWRYKLAGQHVTQRGDASVENLKHVLMKTHQDSLTVYSNIYDLKNKVIYTYPKRQFDRPIVISLPDIFQHEACTALLDSVAQNGWAHCGHDDNRDIVLHGKVVTREGKGIPYVNVGLFDKNIGTISDPDGSFELRIPSLYSSDSIWFSSIGFNTKKIAATSAGPVTIVMTEANIMLREIVVEEKRNMKKARLGWMGGRDGVLPFDTVQGGGAVALLVESPHTPFSVEEVHVRLMYNSKDTLVFRLHFFSYDSVRHEPGAELLTTEIMLKETKRFGWLRFDLSQYQIMLNEKHFCVAFEWIDDRDTRNRMLTGLRDWERWRREQYTLGNPKVKLVGGEVNGVRKIDYKYHGNMMDWPGFKMLPPFTGLMVETGKSDKTIKLKTFERKTSFGQWREIQSTLNAVVVIRH